MKKNIITIDRNKWKTPTELAKELGHNGTQRISMAINRGLVFAWRPEGLNITLVDRKSALRYFKTS